MPSSDFYSFVSSFSTTFHICTRNVSNNIDAAVGQSEYRMFVVFEKIFQLFVSKNIFMLRQTSSQTRYSGGWSRYYDTNFVEIISVN